jgi:hypothetical protein
MTEYEIDPNPGEPLPVPEQPEKPVNVSGVAVNDVTGNSIRISQCGVRTVNGKTIEIDTSGVQMVNSDIITLSNGGIGIAHANTLSVNGSLGIASAQEASVTGTVGVLIGQTAVLNESRTGVLITKEVTSTKVQAVIVLAGEINGPVETIVDQRSVALFGLAAGVALGLVLNLFRFLRRR